MTLDDTSPVCGVCGDRDPFCCGGETAAEPAELDPVEHLRREYATVEANLWAELRRHGREHGCDPDYHADEPPACDLYRALRDAWSAIHQESEAAEWLIGGKVPEGFGSPRNFWLEHYVAGPWSDPATMWVIAGLAAPVRP